jgi:glutathione S-transferase
MLSFCGAYNGLGSTGSARTCKESVVRGYESWDILETRLKKHEWLALDRPTIADVKVCVYVALSPMGDVVLGGHSAAKVWIELTGKLESFIKIGGLDGPFCKRRAGVETTHPSVRQRVKKIPA